MPYEFTNDEIVTLREVFTLFDQEGFELLKVQQLKHILETLGQRKTDEEIQEIIKEFDPEDSGQINFGCFLTIVATTLENTDDNDELRDAFRVFDHEGNGKVCAAELRHMLMNFGKKLTDAEAKELIKQVYIDDDGLQDFEEYINILRSKS